MGNCEVLIMNKEIYRLKNELLHKICDRLVKLKQNPNGSKFKKYKMSCEIICTRYSRMKSAQRQRHSDKITQKYLSGEIERVVDLPEMLFLIEFGEGNKQIRQKLLDMIE
jgi:hypothetical protein